MFGDTITYLGQTYSKINQDQYGATYRYATALFEARINVRHTSRVDKARSNIRVDRHNIEVTIRTFGISGAPDALDKYYLVVENDAQATLASTVANVDGMFAMLQASTKALLTKLCNWES